MILSFVVLFTISCSRASNIRNVTKEETEKAMSNLGKKLVAVSNDAFENFQIALYEYDSSKTISIIENLQVLEENDFFKNIRKLIEIKFIKEHEPSIKEYKFIIDQLDKYIVNNLEELKKDKLVKSKINKNDREDFLKLYSKKCEYIKDISQNKLINLGDKKYFEILKGNIKSEFDDIRKKCENDLKFLKSCGSDELDLIREYYETCNDYGNLMTICKEEAKNICQLIEDKIKTKIEKAISNIFDFNNIRDTDQFTKIVAQNIINIKKIAGSFIKLNNLPKTKKDH